MQQRKHLPYDVHSRNPNTEGGQSAESVSKYLWHFSTLFELSVSNSATEEGNDDCCDHNKVLEALQRTECKFVEECQYEWKDVEEGCDDEEDPRECDIAFKKLRSPRLCQCERGLDGEDEDTAKDSAEELLDDPKGLSDSPKLQERKRIQCENCSAKENCGNCLFWSSYSFALDAKN